MRHCEKRGKENKRLLDYTLLPREIVDAMTMPPQYNRAAKVHIPFNKNEP